MALATFRSFSDGFWWILILCSCKSPYDLVWLRSARQSPATELQEKLNTVEGWDKIAGKRYVFWPSRRQTASSAVKEISPNWKPDFRIDMMPSAAATALGTLTGGAIEANACVRVEGWSGVGRVTPCLAR